MRRLIFTVGLSAVLFCIVLQIHTAAAQVIAGTDEDKLFQQIVTASNADAKLQLLVDFDKRFPQSKVLPDVYLMAIDLYRKKNDRTKILEYGEKTLKVDQNNITAMMALSRNYALEGKNLDRAVQLGEQAVRLIETMKTQSTPPRFTDSQWKTYLQSTEGAAKTILEYAKTIKAR